ncbi:MAG: Phosphatase YwpJ [Chlamydiae bacterium]|nr:Phosphatase YwpJ [Chlamydiota bacterium]
MSGLIALDIDGTVTCDHDTIPGEVLAFLDDCVDQGFDLIFITGRSYPRTVPMIQLKSPYYLAVQNGAQCFHVPSEELIFDRFLDPSLLPYLEQICQEEPTGMLVFDATHEEDICYFRESDFSRDLFEYLVRRREVFREKWVEVEDFPKKRFPAVKYFGFLDSLERICGHMHRRGLKLDAPIIRDPFGEGYYVVQATAHGVNKGDALTRFAAHRKNGGPLIAAGDDYNDMSMLQAADKKVVMRNAPREILDMADVVAAPASEMGIIEGLKRAIG